LDNYYSSGNQPLYGAGNGFLTGQGIENDFTVGIYYAAGDITGSVTPDPTGTAIPTTQNANFILGTGIGATAPIGVPGYFTTGGSSPFEIDAATPPPGGTIYTAEVVAYTGSDYKDSAIRGHSAAFTVPALPSGTQPGGSGYGEFNDVGCFMPGFSVFPVPEPATLALAGFGLACLSFWRRKQ
jgi:hypothetical protein